MIKKVKHISRPIKFIAVRFLLSIIEGFKVILKSFFYFLKIIFIKPFYKILNLFYRYIIINIYKLLLAIKRLIYSIIPAEKIKIIYIFVNKYVSHIVIIILVVTISFANILTSETRAEGFGESSVLYALATGGNLEEQYLEEGLETGGQVKMTSYLDTQTTAVSAPANILTTEEAPETAEESTITAKGSALDKPKFASIETSKQHRDETIEYIVQEGDTTSTIASQFDISTNTILWENNLSKNDFIKPGQKLYILPTTGVSYKVASGDTLEKIAKKYEGDIDKIIEFNKLADAQDIKVGETLIIPAGQPYYAPVKQKTKLASVKQIFKPTHVHVPASSKMAWPTTARRISQYYSWRHQGLDIDGEFGDPIWAAEDGIVTKVAYLKYGYGYHVIVDHGGGKQTLYAHFQKIYVTQGQHVVRGDVLGEQGSTGYSTGSHLHLEVRIGGKRYNPLSYIK